MSSHISFGKQAVLIIVIIFARRRATAQKSESYCQLCRDTCNIIPSDGTINGSQILFRMTTHIRINDQLLFNLTISDKLKAKNTSQKFLKIWDVPRTLLLSETKIFSLRSRFLET